VEPDLALLDEADQRRHDRVAHVLHRDAAAITLARDEVVALQQIDAVNAQAPEARLERADDGGGQVRRGYIRHAEFRADVELRLQRAQHLAEIRFRLAFAVERRRVEVVHSELESARDGALAFGRRAADQQAAHVAAAEAQHSDAESRPSERAIVHARDTSGPGSYNDGHEHALAVRL